MEIIKLTLRMVIMRKLLLKLEIINKDYIKALMIYWEKSILRYPEALREKIIDTINIIKNTKKWNWEYGLNIDENYKTIDIYGFLDFIFEFSGDKIYFKDQPPYRYWGWFSMDKIIRDEWRKYLFQIVDCFGGNRVIYLPDNMSDAEKYQDYFDEVDSPFEEIESDLINEYGKNNYIIDNMSEDDGNEYYIDNFENLEIKNTIPLIDFIKYLEEDKFNENKHFYFA
jgi:hypothetical protein